MSVPPTGRQAYNVARRTDVSKAILQLLPVEDRRSGRATHVLTGVLSEYWPDINRDYVRDCCARLDKGGMLTREMNGKRTYKIALTDKGKKWAEAPADPGVALQTPEQAQPPRPPDPSPPDFDYEKMAHALLKQCVRVASQPIEHKEAEDAATGRLAGALEQSERWRHKHQQAADELERAKDRVKALLVERDGLRVRLRQAEENITLLTKKNGHVVDAEVRKQVDRLMREKPLANANRGDG